MRLRKQRDISKVPMFPFRKEYSTFKKSMIAVFSTSSAPVTVCHKYISTVPLRKSANVSVIYYGIYLKYIVSGDCENTRRALGNISSNATYVTTHVSYVYCAGFFVFIILHKITGITEVKSLGKMKNNTCNFTFLYTSLFD